MKTFALHPKMLTLTGVFYPTGYAFIMFPEGAQAEQAGRELEENGFDSEAVMLLEPDTILREIGRVDGESDVILPSVGTEGATVQKYVTLARQGQHALMVHAPSEKETERVMTVVRKQPFSYAQKYHMLAMEDLE
ncbi:MAG: RNA-binding protein [Polaromonas sp.]|uniref:RNA-binding protein n=1 Tax=Polaromonas sp. TaxID=1869339 RepID=UPI00272F530F|nr:RNA-binding protein [Polaromonas sp.]MDP2448400.1 RNA-binding protein [Polaromonas sp.]MDP3248707.1 RNA-binding protein [Polaromonas sp.]MDP3758074.1 RNA-binding protein [Polaromonas sp.]